MFPQNGSVTQELVVHSHPCVSFRSLSLMTSISLSLASRAVENPDDHRGDFRLTGAEIRPEEEEELSRQAEDDQKEAALQNTALSNSVLSRRVCKRRNDSTEKQVHMKSVFVCVFLAFFGQISTCNRYFEDISAL